MVVFKALQSFEYGLSIVLIELGSSLTSLGSSVSDANLAHKCTAGFSDLYDFAFDSFYGLSEISQGLCLFSLVLAALLSFVFGMPLAATIFYGNTPVLSPIPLPSATSIPDDRDKCIYELSDTKPLLSDPDAEGGVFRGPSIEAYSPATAEKLGLVPADTISDVSRKIELARNAQKEWCKTSFQQRSKVMNVLKAYILEEQEDLAALCLVDTGKTMLDASLGEILPTLEKLRWVVAEGPRALAPERRTTGPQTVHKQATVEFVPLGVIGAIAPWNYSLHNLFNPAIASLFAGNAVVVKPSEHSVYSSVYFARIIRRALTLCGHSPDLFQILVGGGDIGAALVDGEIDKLYFTGSTAVGRKVALSAAKRLLPVVLELGGKDPFIICDDAPIARTVDFCLRAVFQNAGQNCVGAERIFIHSAVKDEAVSRLVAAAKDIRLGVDMGALTLGEEAIARIQDLIDDAVGNGAKVLVGGRAGRGEGMYCNGHFYQATVLDFVRPEMRIAREEVFGPVLSIIEWNNDEDLIEMVNDCSFGLGSSIFTNNPERANKILRNLRVGMCNVNDFATNYLCQSMPFGGTRDSGIDRFAGIEGLRGCCLTQSVTRDRFPFLRTTIPRNIKYPVLDNAFEFCSELNEMFYASNWLSRVDNLRNIVIMLLSKTWEPYAFRR